MNLTSRMSQLVNIQKFNFHQLAVSIDQVFNVITCIITFKKGWADETLSAAAYRESKSGRRFCEKFINTLFFWQNEHCKNAYLSELQRNHLPPEERNLEIND